LLRGARDGGDARSGTHAPDATTKGGADANRSHEAGAAKDVAGPTDAHDAAIACAPACADGSPCTANADCASSVCTAGVCAASTWMFGGDVADGLFVRYAIAKGQAPVLSLAYPSPSASFPLVGPTGELFVGDYTGGSLQRYLDPYGAPSANGTIGSLSNPQGLIFVDDRLWVTNQGGGNIVVLAFSDAGVSSVAATISSGLSDVIREVAWSPVTRVAYVSLCCGKDKILGFPVAADGSVTGSFTNSDAALNNPNGVIVSPWNELFVANAGANSILRYSLSASGAMSPNGSITGNGLGLPVSLAFAPWGELFVTNQSNNTLSRFTFDASHAASSNETYSPAHTIGGWLWIPP